MSCGPVRCNEDVLITTRTHDAVTQLRMSTWRSRITGYAVSAYVVDRLGFSSGAVLAARVVIAFAVVGLLLREHAPGNMGLGFLAGAAGGLVGAAVLAWRVLERPGRATTFERAWTQPVVVERP